MRTTSFVFALAVAALMSAPAVAAPFSNGDFETGTNPVGQTTLPNGSTNVTGWTTIGSQSVYFGNSFQAFSGSRSVGVYGTSGVTQTFSVTPGQTYTVSFRYSAFPRNDGQVDGLTSNVVSGAQNASITVGFPNSFSSTVHNQDSAVWLPVSYSFVAADTQAVLTFLGVSGGIFAASGQAIIDNVAVTAVPIPMALPLFLAGLGALGVLRRARSKSQASA